MSGSGKHPSPSILDRREIDAEGWERCEHLNKSEAERLLDWLEAHGYSRKEVLLTDDGGFTVRWHR